MKLYIEKISKSYGSVKALQNISFSMEPGIYALLGPNGSGKSTLMNILIDNLKADSGAIRYTDGKSEPENVLSMGVRFREKIGFMPQYPGLYPGFTVYNFLLYMATLKNMAANLRGKEKKAYLHKEIMGLLEAVDLSDCVRRRISTLSGGMKQRLALAQALLGDPQIIILDEPTAGLDPMQRMAVRNIIARIALDRIVLIATHVVTDVESIAKEVIILRRGKLFDMASPAALATKMAGQVWLLSCTEEDALAIRSGYEGKVNGRADGHVINIAPSENMTLPITLRILASDAPAPEAMPVTPNLEDYYLWIFGEEKVVK